MKAIKIIEPGHPSKTMTEEEEDLIKYLFGEEELDKICKFGGKLKVIIETGAPVEIIDTTQINSNL